MDFSYRQIGDFNKAKKRIDSLSKNLQNAQKEILAKVALKAEAMAVERLQSQPSDWDPLNKDYKAQKIREGYSSHTLIRTSTMFQSITSFVKGNKAYAGILKTEKNKDGESIANIAAIHEYGSVKRNIPARPIWRVVRIDIAKWLASKKIFIEIFEEHI